MTREEALAFLVQERAGNAAHTWSTFALRLIAHHAITVEDLAKAESGEDGEDDAVNTYAAMRKGPDRLPGESDEDFVKRNESSGWYSLDKDSDLRRTRSRVAGREKRAAEKAKSAEQKAAEAEAKRVGARARAETDVFIVMNTLLDYIETLNGLLDEGEPVWTVGLVSRRRAQHEREREADMEARYRARHPEVEA